MPSRAIFFDVGETLIAETRLLLGWADTMGVDRAEFIAVLDDIIAKGENYRLVFERLRPRLKSFRDEAGVFAHLAQLQSEDAQSVMGFGHGTGLPSRHEGNGQRPTTRTPTTA